MESEIVTWKFDDLTVVALSVGGCGSPCILILLNMSTSDDHDELSDSDFIDYPEHYDDDDDDPHRARSLAMLPIPDLRFEQSYLKSIKAFVHIEQTSVSNESRKLEGQEIGQDVTPIVDSSHQLVKIDWGKVVWVTFRDQIISPLFQGALWYAIFSFSTTPHKPTMLRN